MLKPVNVQKLIEAGLGTRLGDNWTGKRCGAKTRHGLRCKNPAVTGRERCRMHGGKSTGPRTQEGKAKIAAAHWKHGRRSKQHVEARKIIWAELRKIEARMRIIGLLD